MYVHRYYGVWGNCMEDALCTYGPVFTAPRTLQNFLKAIICYSLIGIAMPYPLESSVLPISIRLQLRSVSYSMLDDSMRNAYRPLPLSTRSTPSWLLFVNTVGLDASITLHILWYKLKFDFCTIYSTLSLQLPLYYYE